MWRGTKETQEKPKRVCVRARVPFFSVEQNGVPDVFFVALHYRLRMCALNRNVL